MEVDRVRYAVIAVLLGIILSSAGPVGAALAGHTVFNNYSRIVPGMPNYGIAQGSIFLLAGTNDLTEVTASQKVPLQTTLAGVTITVMVGGVTTQAIPYSVSPSQVTAILPSKTPVGEGTITVTSGSRSSTSPVTVVQSAFGLLTAEQLAGSGTAVAQNASQGGQIVSQMNAANPGETLVLWGSGLGPISDDETQYQTPRDLSGIPIQVDIGGVSATVTYHGRSADPGLDQINVIVPASVSGCNVSVVVTAGGVPSNFATIPVASSGRACSDPDLVPITSSEYQGLLRLGSVHVGTIFVTSDSAFARFEKYTGQEFSSNSFLQQASLASCLVVTGWVPAIPVWKTFTALNAGPQITVKGPNGSLVLPRDVFGNYAGSPGISPSGGVFDLDNGPGGPDVGAFHASLDENVTAPLIWTNRSTIGKVDRARGQVITWTGGIPGSYVSISGYSYINEPAATASAELPYYIYFTCSAPVSAGQFTVPAAVLESLPPTGSVRGQLTPSGDGYLEVANGSIQRFTAPGLDLGLVFLSASGGISVPFR
jgi:uncharacterized protein (TIGR03437 family)